MKLFLQFSYQRFCQTRLIEWRVQKLELTSTLSTKLHTYKKTSG